MKKKLNSFMLLLVIVAVAMTSAVRTTLVYADDGGTEPIPEEGAAPPGEEESSTEEESAPAAEPAVKEPAPAVEEGNALRSGEEASTDEETAPEEPISVPEVLEQLPEDTALVVVNDEGEVEPLATAEAAEIIATGDPIWCSAAAPIIGAGEVGCTGSHGTFQDLIITLAANPALYSGDGTIWVEATYAGNDNVQIQLDGANPNLSALRNGNLTIQGGWTGGTTVSGRSAADVSMIVNNWTGNIAIRNFDINPEDNTGFGLYVNTQGTITLNDVSVIDTELNPSGFGDGAELTSTGNGAVSITNGVFSQNAGNGLLVDTGGTITLTNVTANQNRLTGASLNGSGAVTIAGAANQFNNNGSNTASHGLVVHTDAGITMNNVEANNNALRGASLSADQNVTIGASTFSGNVNGTGLYVSSGGNIDLTGNVYSYSNSMGAQLYTTGTGGITVTNSGFGVNSTGDLLGNTATGLHAESGGAIILNNVIAADNQNNGAYLIAEGAISVTNSTFNANVQVCSPADPGIYAWSNGGNITLNHVFARENVCGTGAVLKTSGAGVIDVINNSIFNSNGTFGVQAQTEDGNITLNGVIANFNQVKGAYLGAFSGDIAIDNSGFVENGSYGIYAFTSEGDMDLNLVTVSGSDGGVGPGADDLTDYGAILDAGGDVSVTNSTFQLNTDVGLGIISGGQANLSNVTADSNGGNGVEVYSITTAGPICSGEQPVNIVVTVNGTAYTNNGGYGLLVKPGPGGTLVFVNPSTFGGNALGNYLLDLSQQYKDCTCKPEDKPEDKPEEPSKGPLVVEVPATGGPIVAQDCDQYTGTIMILPNDTQVKVGCPFEGFSHLEEVLEENLPTPIGAGIDFVAGIVLGLTDGQGNAILNEDGTVTISFAIPEDSQAKHYSIVFWDPTLNDGAGGWMELPPYEVGTSFALHPDDPDDPHTVLSGVKRVGNIVIVTVDFSGTFVLVEQ